jgi:hypothetical protein
MRRSAVKRPRWLADDLPTTFGLIVSLWLCALIVIAVVVAPLFGLTAAWATAITVLLFLVPICRRITAKRTFRS